MKKLAFAISRCTGCRQCELACSMYHERLYNPLKARIRTRRIGLPPRTELVMCEHCDEPACLEACAPGAMSIDDLTGAVVVNLDECTGCGACEAACITGVISMHPDKGYALKCDLCNGLPECVRSCPKEALRYE